MGSVTGRIASKVGRPEHGHGELREDVALRGDGERLAGRGAFAREQRLDGLADAGGVRIGHEQAHVVAQVLERLLPLQRGQGIGEDGGAPRVEGVDDERPDVGMLDEIALHARSQDAAGDRGAADGRLRQSQGSANVAEKTAGIVLGGGRVQRPCGVDVVDGGEDPAVADREHRWKVDGGDPAEKGIPRRCHVVAGPLGGVTNPCRAELRPGELPQGAQRMRRGDQRRLADLPPVILDDESNGVHGQGRPERYDRLELIAARRPFDLRGQIPEKVVIGGGVGENRRCVAQEIEALGDEVPGPLDDPCEVRRTGVEEAPHRGRRRPLIDVAGRHLRLAHVDPHPPAHGTFGRVQDSLLDVLQPARDRDPVGAFPAELRLDDLLRGCPPPGAALDPAHAFRRDVRRLAILQERGELPVDSAVLDAVGPGRVSLRRLLFETGLGQDVERFALVRALSGLPGGIVAGGIVDGQGVAVRGPGQDTHTVPAFLEIDPVESRERDLGVRPRRLPDPDLSGSADGSGVMGDDLHREVVQPLDPARVGIHFHDGAEGPPLLRRQHLLPDQIGQPVVRFLVIGDDGEIGLHAHERDPVGHDPGAELPLVERQIPVLAVEDDVARPCRGILDARLRQILGQPPPQPPVDEIEVQHPSEHRRVPVREPPDAFEVPAHAPPGGGRVVEELEVRDQPELVEGAAQGLAVVAVRPHAEQVAHLGHRIGPAPSFLPQVLQDVPRVSPQRGGNALQQLPPKPLVGIVDPEVLERRAAERILGAGAQVRRQEDAQRRAQRAVRQGVAQLDQLRRGDVEILVGPRLAVREHVDVGRRDLAAKPSGQRDHQLRPQVGHPHAVPRPSIPQRRGQGRQEQALDRVREVGGRQGAKGAAHAAPPLAAAIV